MTSNACKFTPSGGKVSISTQLVWPIILPKSEPADRMPEAPSVDIGAPNMEHRDDAHMLSASHVAEHNRNLSKISAPLEWIVVRIEVTDNGYGIKPADMVQSKLFCKCFIVSRCQSTELFVVVLAAFNQTEKGRQQGSSHF
jgi:osomolarity two-component system sensor histidine kinase SLN1